MWAAEGTFLYLFVGVRVYVLATVVEKLSFLLES